MRRRILYSNQGNNGTLPDGSKAKTCDVVFANKNTEKLVITSEWSISLYPSEEWVPIGVVVIPGEHGVLKNGSGIKNQCGVMSLVEMDYDAPEKGNDFGKQFYWCSQNIDISGKTDGLGRYDSVTNGLQNYNVTCHVGNNGNPQKTVQGISDDSALPKEGVEIDGRDWINNPYDSGTAYWNYDGIYFVPSPYNNDGTYNSNYGQTKSPSSPNNAMSDFKGIVNTKIITDLATGQSDWKTASKIIDTNKGSTYYPAACCCARFKTIGTKAFVDCTTEELRNGAGFWYMPAEGELGYIMPRIKQINQTLNRIYEVYEIGYQILENLHWYWASTESGNNNTYVLNTGNAIVSSTYKTNSYYVRAFMRL